MIMITLGKAVDRMWPAPLPEDDELDEGDEWEYDEA